MLLIRLKLKHQDIQLNTQASHLRQKVSLDHPKATGLTPAADLHSERGSVALGNNIGSKEHFKSSIFSFFKLTVLTTTEISQINGKAISRSL